MTRTSGQAAAASLAVACRLVAAGASTFMGDDLVATMAHKGCR